MPSAYQMTCRNQICANQAFSISNGLTVVALATNAAPSSIKPASAMICTRSSLLYFSLNVSAVIFVFSSSSSCSSSSSNCEDDDEDEDENDFSFHFAIASALVAPVVSFFKIIS